MQRNNLRKQCFLLLFCLLGCFRSEAQPVFITQLHKFNGVYTAVRSFVAGPADGALYGTVFTNTSTSGIIFTINRDGSGYVPIHVIANRITQEFQADLPEASVIEAGNGELYGVSAAGGANNAGILFTLHPNGSGYRILHDFSSSESLPASLIQGGDGALYGMGTTIFKINLDGSGYATLHAFSDELTSLHGLGQMVQGSDGGLYGAAYGTFMGNTGTNGESGMVFRINTNGTGFTVLHIFGTAGDGKNPIGGLMEASNGTLYGTTAAGGTSDHGTIFKINPDGGGYSILHNLAGPPTDGDGPAGTLAEGLGGALFGTTFAGGSKDNGTIFKIGADGGGYTTVFNFTNGTPSGAGPFTGLIRGRSQNDIGVFYGSTAVDAGIFAMLINPPLQITPVTGPPPTNQTVIFWPEWAINYKLQSTTNVASSNWVNVTSGVPVTGVQVTSTNPAVFYRLVSP